MYFKHNFAPTGAPDTNPSPAEGWRRNKRHFFQMQSSRSAERQQPCPAATSAGTDIHSRSLPISTDILITAGQAEARCDAPARSAISGLLCPPPQQSIAPCQSATVRFSRALLRHASQGKQPWRRQTSHQVAHLAKKPPSSLANAQGNISVQ